MHIFKKIILKKSVIYIYNVLSDFTPCTWSISSQYYLTSLHSPCPSYPQSQTSPPQWCRMSNTQSTAKAEQTMCTCIHVCKKYWSKIGCSCVQQTVLETQLMDLKNKKIKKSMWIFNVQDQIVWCSTVVRPVCNYTDLWLVQKGMGNVMGKMSTSACSGTCFYLSPS